MAVLKSDGKAILIVFIGLIITIVLISAVADSVYTQRTVLNSNNATITLPSAANTTVDITGRELVGTATISNGTLDLSDNFTVSTGTSATTGLRSVQITSNDSSPLHYGDIANVSYTYRADGYLNNSGARSVAWLIVIFSALAMVVFVIVVFIKHGSLGSLMRGFK